MSADCNVCDGVFIEDGAIVGDRVTVQGAIVQLWKGVRLEDDVFVRGERIANDPLPRSRQWLDSIRTVVRARA